MRTPDDTSMQIFDPGLQPERTRLSWTRTLLSMVVVCGVVLKVSSHHHLPASVTLFVVGAALALLGSQRAQARYRRFTATHQLHTGGIFLALVAGYIFALGIFALYYLNF